MFSLNSRTWLRGLSRRQDSIFSIRRTFSSSASRDFDYDLAVIGGGSGGLAAAKEAMAVDPSLKVVCFDFVSPTSHNTKWGLGGTCVNVGCIPKKLMHYSSHLGHEAMKDAKEYGWKFPQGEITHDWGTMSSTITDYVRSLNFSYRMGLTGAGVKYLNAKAHMKDANTIAFRDSRGKEGEISADKVILAVGGRPYVTENTPGHELCMTSDDIFWDKRPEGPGKTLVIGGGYIAMECAGFLHGLGYDTTIMVRSQVMRQFDDQAGSMVAEMMERDGVRFLQQTSHKSFRVRDENKPVLPEGARKVSEHTYAHASPGDHDSLDGDDVLYQLPFGKSDDGEFVYHQLNRKKLRMEKYQHPSGVIETRTYFTTNMNIANLNAGADSGVGDGDGERSNGEYSSTYKVPAGPIIAKYAAEDGREVEEEFDTVLMAIGRAACVEGLGLDHPSVNVQLSNNKVLVDDYEKTTIDNIYCIGDAAVGIPSHAITSSSSDASSSSSVVPKDRPELTPVAIQAGQLLARRLFGADELTMDYSSIPTTVFTPNEYAFIGLTEDEARAQARKDSDRDNANGGDSNNKEDSDHIEVYWSRFGNLEISPTHVAATDLDKARSSHFSGFRSYARRYTREKKTWWEGVNFEVEDQVCIYPQRDGQVAEALEAAGIQLCSEGPEDDGDTSVKGNDDDSDDRGDNHMMLGKVMKRYQDDEGQWLYDVEVGVDFEPESNSDNSDTEHTSTPDHEHEHEHEHGLIELSCLSDTVLEHEDQTGKDLDELWKKANCLAKLVVDKRSDQVLGIHFVGPNAGEVMQGYSLAFALGKRLATKRNNNDGDNLGGVGLTKTDFDHLIGIHPTAAEEFTVLTVKQSDVESTFLKKAGCGGGSCG